MFFWLKKFISFWLMPVPMGLALLLAGLWLTRNARRARLGRTLLIVATGMFALFTNKVVSKALIAPLESRYPAIPEFRAGAPLNPALAACQFVVVLGSGHTDAPGLASTHQLSDAGLARITEGARLLRVLPDAKLVVSGPPIGANPAHATVLARAAESLGIAHDRIIFIDTARDTEDEALAVKKLTGGDARVALVTSAWHMPRAAGLFRHAGVNILPCPAGFLGRRNRDFRFDDLTWDSESLSRSTAAVHEYLGLLWNALRGKT